MRGNLPFFCIFIFFIQNINSARHSYIHSLRDHSCFLFLLTWIRACRTASRHAIWYTLHPELRGAPPPELRRNQELCRTLELSHTLDLHRTLELRLIYGIIEKIKWCKPGPSRCMGSSHRPVWGCWVMMNSKHAYCNANQSLKSPPLPPIWQIILYTISGLRKMEVDLVCGAQGRQLLNLRRHFSEE